MWRILWPPEMFTDYRLLITMCHFVRLRWADCILEYWSNTYANLRALFSASFDNVISWLLNELGSPRARTSRASLSPLSFDRCFFILLLLMLFIFSKRYHAHIGLVIYRTLFYILNSEQWAHYTLLESGRACCRSRSSGDSSTVGPVCMVRVF